MNLDESSTKATNVDHRTIASAAARPQGNTSHQKANNNKATVARQRSRHHNNYPSNISTEQSSDLEQSTTEFTQSLRTSPRLSGNDNCNTSPLAASSSASSPPSSGSSLRRQRSRRGNRSNLTSPTNTSASPSETESPTLSRKRSSPFDSPATTTTTDLTSPSLSKKLSAREERAKRRAIYKETMEQEEKVENNNNNPAEEIDEEEDQDEEVADFAQQHLQSLLRRLGAGFDVVMGGHGGSNSSKLKNILTGLKAIGDDDSQLMAVTELNEYLSMATEETVGSFNADEFIPPLIELLQMEYNPEMMLLACRCFANMVEAFPNTAASIVHHEVIPILVQKLLNIEYIDLAEQALTTLEKISLEHPLHILRAGGLGAVLMFLDFFPTGVQRSAVTTASNLCRNVPADCFPMVLDVVPNLTGLLRYSDQKIVEKTCLCFSRLIDNLAKDRESGAEKIEKIASNGLVKNMIYLISPSNTVSLSPVTYGNVVRLLARICHASSTLATELLTDEEFIIILRDALKSPSLSSGATASAPMSSTSTPSSVLAGSSSKSSIGGGDGAVSTPVTTSNIKSPSSVDNLSSTASPMIRSSDQIFEIMSVLIELLPPIAREGFFDMQISSSHASQSNVALSSLSRLILKSKYRKRVPTSGSDTGATTTTPTPTTGKAKADSDSSQPTPMSIDSPSSSSTTREDPRISLLDSNPTIMHQLGTNILSCLFDVYATTISPGVRYKCSLVIIKILYFSSPETLKAVLQDIPVSSFLAGLIASRDQMIVVAALQMGHLLLLKLPEIFNVYLKREGFIHELENIINGKLSDSLSPSTPQTSQATEASSSSSSASSLYASAATASSGKISELLGNLRRQMSNNGDSKSPTPSQTPTPLPVTPMKKSSDIAEEVQEWIRQHAEILYSQYQKAAQSESTSDTIVAKELENVVTSLSSADLTLEEFFNMLLRASTLFVESDVGASSFEIVNSGFIPKLIHVLTAKDYFKLNRKQRLSVFIRVFMNGPRLNIKDDVTDLSQGLYKFSCLIHRLNETVKKLEQFSVIIHEVGGQDSRRGIFSGLRLLGQPFKIKLRKHSQETNESLKDYSSNVVMIEPLATVKAIEDFLLPKVYQKAAASSSSSTASLVSAAGSIAESSLDSNYSEEAEEEDDEESEMEEEPSSMFRNRMDSSRSSRTRNDSEVVDLQLNDDLKSSNSGSSLRRTSSMAGGSEKNTEPAPEPKLQLYLGDKPLSSTMSIFQAIEKYGRQSLEHTEATSSSAPLSSGSSGRYLWSATYTLNYRLLDTKKSDMESGSSASLYSASHTLKHPSSSLLQYRNDLTELNAALDGTLQCNLEVTSPLTETLILLRILYNINSHWELIVAKQSSTSFASAQPISTLEFVNTKLSAKLIRQLQDTLSLCSGSLPEWCRELTRSYPFLFSFESRHMFLISTAFGIARALTKLQERTKENVDSNSGSNSGEAIYRVSRIQRQKVRIDRNRLFESALKVLELYGTNKSMLEIEYFDEVGTGLGPTLEFYANVSKEFRLKKHGLWRDADPNDGSHVVTPYGLIPAPLSAAEAQTESGKKKLQFFRILGVFVGKALLDFRTVDLPFNSLFYKWIIGEESSFGLMHLRELDPVLAKPLFDLEQFCQEKERIQLDSSMSDEEKKERIGALTIQDVPLEDLSLFFTLPGYDYELKSNGSNIMVGIDNVEEYVQLVVSCSLVGSIRLQMNEFRKGFSSVFPITELRCFLPFELDILINGVEESWDYESLLEAIKCDHGYTSDSPVIHRFVKVLAEFTPEERVMFLKFVTGSPRLPVGGLRSLNPPFTVVRKTPEGPYSADTYLPSAMTCANYLKLPDYSSADILRSKLLFAMKEGQNSFHLS